jgi:hypothetical protein
MPVLLAERRAVGRLPGTAAGPTSGRRPEFTRRTPGGQAHGTAGAPGRTSLTRVSDTCPLPLSLPVTRTTPPAA